MYRKRSRLSAALSVAVAGLLAFLASPAPASAAHAAPPDAARTEQAGLIERHAEAGAPTAGLLKPAPTASATEQPAQRLPGKAAAVYYLKGYSKDDNPGVNCKTYWGPLPRAMSDWGWNGPVHHAGYYKGDKNCKVKLAAKDQSVSIRTLGRELAKHIYTNYTSKGRPVKLIGHSMGGLVARAALTGVLRHEPGFPESLWVEDVVTFDTGHQGHNWTGFCSSRQCKDQRRGSYFLKTWALDNPQGAGGTDWTLLSVDEFPTPDRVMTQSALGMNSNHFVHYKYFQADHGNLPEKVSGHFKFWYQRRGYPVRHVGQGASPGRMADLALSTARW